MEENWRGIVTTQQPTARLSHSNQLSGLMNYQTNMNQTLVPSPYGPSNNSKEVTKEVFERIRKELGVECLLLVVETKANDCDGDDCMGHMTFFRSEGFNPHNLAGIGAAMMDNAEEISKSNKLP